MTGNEAARERKDETTQKLWEVEAYLTDAYEALPSNPAGALYEVRRALKELRGLLAGGALGKNGGGGENG